MIFTKLLVVGRKTEVVWRMTRADPNLHCGDLRHGATARSFVPVYINAAGRLGTALASPAVIGGQPTGIGLDLPSQQLQDTQTTIADLRARLAQLEALFAGDQSVP
jgi:hypothetical protein